MVLIDAETAGYVSAWLENGGSLDARGPSILLCCIVGLDQAMTVLSQADDPARHGAEAGLITYITTAGTASSTLQSPLTVRPVSPRWRPASPAQPPATPA
ncbi:hypothetical protein ACN6LA_000265 [Streptomyces sp. SAS_269]|uniref:hypothetical protein n=1 Tax=Streptomyces sp. SAS_269 TaxID=3412749 RepID=UPI00403CF3DE